MGDRHLARIQEETASREHSCLLPSIPPCPPPGSGQVKEAEGATGLPYLSEQQETPEDDMSLLAQLGRIEAALRESERLDERRRQEIDFMQQQENKQLRENFCYLSLSQRVAKPWVSSYFRRFPMHIYCLPVQVTNHRGRRRRTRRGGGAS